MSDFLPGYDAWKTMSPDEENKMTEAEARHLAKLTRCYRARKMHGQWVVWCDESDHVVEFDTVDTKRPDAVALDVARALAEPLTGLDFDDMLESQQDELLTAAWAAMKSLEQRR